MPEEKKIDLGWKEQAQREKAKLAEELDSREPQVETPAEAGDPGELSEPTFTNLVTGMAAQALMFLGMVENPVVGSRVLDLPAARHYLDLLAMLGEKTRNNLTPEEQRTLSSLVGELRLYYVEAAKALANAQAEQARKLATEGPKKG